ncbi:hypothetical protein [Kineosporia sp. NBRC 101731]|uniref:hypothetical protein n=1 Tax=Kineosporia sp. NBRC 101731 TaxID=3032199 RepID=UPI0024A19DFF|nr:hypothetical protein [Kineosporia sp. NBRC 101731]GLY32002.1 hypothetical protein Kisp02_53670 [Kineosporia sp. NBRC 101731]
MTVETYTMPEVPEASGNLDGLIQWTQAADAVYKVAQKICETTFCPAAYQRKPFEATAAILAGSEVGLSPMAALKAFDVIQGQAAPRAITLRAIVQSRGHTIEVVEQTGVRAVVRGRRVGQDEWQTSTWDLDRARGLQLLSKDNWKKQPGAMLVARATSECARLIAADAILGIPYCAEELEDGVYQVTEARPGRAKVAGRALEAIPDQRAPEVEATAIESGEPQARADVSGSVEMIDQEQVAALGEIWKALKVTARERKARVTAAVIGREVASSTDMTYAEADKLLLELAEVMACEDPAAELDLIVARAPGDVVPEPK